MEVNDFFYFIAICGCCICAVMDSITAIVIRKLKGVHFSIINTFYGFFLSILSLLAWLTYRVFMGNMVEYNFDMT